jgi:PAS domain S-box-containing protein/TyrR family helix-turn-helix protein
MIEENSHHPWEKIFSSIPNEVIVVNKEGKVITMNVAAQKMFGEIVENLVGKDIITLIPNNQIPSVLDSGEGSIGVKMEKILEFSSDGIYVVDKEGRTLFVNSSYEEITGFHRSQLIGRHMGELVSQGYIDQSVSLLVLQEKKPISILQRIGKQKDVVVTGNPVFDKAGQIEMVVTSVRDITHLNKVTKELRKARSFSEMNQNRFTFSTDDSGEKVMFQSAQMKEIIYKVKQIAPFPTSILLSGPSGAGKEVIANLIHQLSDRKDRPFIKINCGAIPEQLLESELFGYEKGAFTGARQEGKIGLLELADQGTVLLDEVGELPLSLQVKLLRVLQEKKIQRLGGSKEKKLDIRIISATNQQLDDMITKGTFREDLYYRLKVVELAIPPLSDRPEDIEVLLDHFFSYFSHLYHIEKQLSTETKKILQEYHWPGNVRELRNLVESMIVSVPSLTIEPEDLPPHISRQSTSDSPLSLKRRVEQFEKRIIMDALKKSPSLRKAANQLGVDHSTIVKKVKKWGI